MTRLPNLASGTKRAVIGVLLLGSVFGTAFFTQNISSQIKKLSVIESGVGVCFSRINQSYTAKMIGMEGGTYLSSEFFTATEDCYADSIASLQQGFRTSLKQGLKKINSLAANVHNFHERINQGVRLDKGVSGTETDDLSGLNTRFQKIEELAGEISESVVNLREMYAGYLDNLKMALMVLLSTSVFFIGIEIWIRRQKFDFNNRLEKDAENLLSAPETLPGSEVVTLISSALDGNELKNCSRLFYSYSTQTSKATSSTSFEMPAPCLAPVENKVVPTISSSEVATDDLMDAQDQDFDPQAFNLESVKIDEALTGVINHLASDLFKKGIILDLDTEENYTNVWAEKEGLGQIFLSLISNSVIACERNGGIKKIKIRYKKLGSNILLDVIDNGPGFPDKFIKAQFGLGDITGFFGTGLAICSELMEGFCGTISFENVRAENGKVRGAKVSLLFKAVLDDSLTPKKEARLVSIKKGKKKDLLLQFSQMN